MSETRTVKDACSDDCTIGACNVTIMDSLNQNVPEGVRKYLAVYSKTAVIQL